MTFFSALLRKRNLNSHDGKPLWKYLLSTEEFNELRQTFQHTSQLHIDARDVALYYAQWWKRNYNGGIPSKREIFESLEGNVRVYFDQESFYKLAKKGAEILGVKWIKKQNTLYFKTLLLQGGLPLTHISENHGNYKNFLLAVLEEQPESIEDFIFKPEIIQLLPKSSQNDIVYENCLEIVKSILNNDGAYDDLLGTSESLKDISKALKARSHALVKKERISKPKNYWLLRFKEDAIEIHLRIGLQATYTARHLANILGFESLSGKEYQLFVNDELICVFRKLMSGSYKTDWFQQQDIKWNSEKNLPHTYIIENDTKVDINDFIQTIPNSDEPSLWAPYSANEWRLVKGSGVSNDEAAVLFPAGWNTEQKSETISFYGHAMSWLQFEGEVQLNATSETRKYLSNVSSFDWTVISQKPSWICKSSMPIINRKPRVIVYDEHNNILEARKYNVSIRKQRSFDSWTLLSDARYIDEGCYELKIEKEGVIAYDTVYNLNNLQFTYSSKSIDKAVINIENKGSFAIELKEDAILKIDSGQNEFSLQVDTRYSRIPKGIHGALSLKNQKSLLFELEAPFEGVALLDKEGGILPTSAQLSIANLYGIRILSSRNSETILKIKNKFKKEVTITKEIHIASQPLITFIDEIKRLYYLEDAMNHENKVRLELIEGRNSKTYEISGFKHSLNVDAQFERKVSLDTTNEAMDLFAIPLSENGQQMELIPLLKSEAVYEIPTTEIAKQFIVISSKNSEDRLMPRFVNTDEAFEGLEKSERIELYEQALLAPGFTNALWAQLVTCFNICVDYEIPFSTFDQLRAISRSSEVAAKAFFMLGVHQSDADEYIQKAIPEMEKDLGFCFHWIQKEHWDAALHGLNEKYNNAYFRAIFELLSAYMTLNEMPDVLNYITGNDIRPERVSYQDIMTLRSSLGARVLKELPYGSPIIKEHYKIPIQEHAPVKLLLSAPLAVAESINNLQGADSIWGGDAFREVIRRNIQYSQYIHQEFYNKALSHALNRN